MIPMGTHWTDLGGASDRVYVVQTNAKVIERCMLMTTGPGDLVFDPTCGSGTTAYVAEQGGRRWITTDTSRVALAIARQRLLTSTFAAHKLRGGVRKSRTHRRASSTRPSRTSRSNPLHRTSRSTQSSHVINPFSTRSSHISMSRSSLSQLSCARIL